MPGREEAKQVVRFVLTGFAVVGTDVVVYYLLFLFLPAAAAKAVSFTCGGVVSYLMNKYWTFGQHIPSTGEVVRFILGNGSALFINVGINEGILRANPQWVNPALAAATLITSVYVYVVFKSWVFRPDRPDACARQGPPPPSDEASWV